MTTIPAYPLAWPEGWKRNQPSQRTGSRFGRVSRHEYGTYKIGRKLTINEAVDRVRGEIQRIARTDDVVISTNLELRLDGLPRSGQSEPADPGAAVYWRDPRIDGWPIRCMAIDRYDGDAETFNAIQSAWAAFCAERGIAG